MAKELPYFQFEPAEYLTKDISFCSLSAQGLFINICSYYWQRNCNLTQKQLLKRLDYIDELNELVEEDVIKINEGNITIEFLDNQKDKAIKNSKKNSQNGKKGGRPKTQIKPKINPNETETKGIIKDNIIKEEIIEDNRGNEENPITKFTSWFNLRRKTYLEKESNFKRLSYQDKKNLEELKELYCKEDFEKAFINICNDKYCNEANRIIPNHFLEYFQNYVSQDNKPLLTKKQKINRGWAI